MECGAHSRGESIDGGEGSSDDDSLRRQEGHEVGDAVAQKGSRLADGRRNFGNTVACGGEKLCVVLIDEAGGGQVLANRVGGRDCFEAADVTALAGASRGGLDGDMRDIPSQSTLAHLGHALHEVGATDGGASLDVDERVNGGDAFQPTPVHGFTDGSRARVVFNEGGQTALLRHSLGDVDAIPPGHTGRADDARTVSVHGAWNRQGKAADPHAGSFFLVRHLLHDDVEHRLGAFRNIDEEAARDTYSTRGIRQGDEAVVGSQFNESKSAGSVRGNESTRPAPAGRDRLVRFRDFACLNEAGDGRRNC